MPAAQVPVLCPLVLGCFGYAANDSRHPYFSHLERVVAFEWSVNVTCAIMQQSIGERRAFLVSDGVLNALRPVVADGPRLAAPLVGRDTTRVRSFILRGASHFWTDSIFFEFTWILDFHLLCGHGTQNYDTIICRLRASRTVGAPSISGVLS